MKVVYFFSYGGDEGGWFGCGDERQGVFCGVGRVSCRVQRQFYCDVKQGVGKKEKEKKYQKYRLKRLDIVYNVSLRLMGVFKQLEDNRFVIMSSD